MNTFIWVLQGLLAATFIMSGVMKLMTTKETLAQKMAWAEDFSGSVIKFIGFAEVMGALGLILPLALYIYPELTAVSAFSLALVMVLAMGTHIRRKEMKEVMINIVLMGIALVIAIYRINPS